MTASVELWLGRFDELPTIPHQWTDWLDADERERAARFARPADADAFVARHAMLRHVLGRRMGLHPAELKFARGPYGKPALRPSGTDRPPFFSLSSCGDFALVALCQQGEIGVDLERVLPTGLEAAALFAASERAEIARRSEDEALVAFFRYWVCKEAVVKAAGRGLAIPLNVLEISAPHRPPALLSDDGRFGGTVHLSVVEPAANLMAAVASFAPATIAIRSWMELPESRSS